jgi:hypothetical protein
MAEMQIMQEQLSAHDFYNFYSRQAAKKKIYLYPPSFRRGDNPKARKMRNALGCFFSFDSLRLCAKRNQKPWQRCVLILELP